MPRRPWVGTTLAAATPSKKQAAAASPTTTPRREPLVVPESTVTAGTVPYVGLLSLMSLRLIVFVLVAAISVQ